MSKLLDINNLKVIYKTNNIELQAVNGIKLSIDKKETLGLVGETGAGKTTTALSIMKLLPERTGRVKGGSIKFDNIELLDLNNNEMRNIRGSRISMIFQDPMTSLNPILTVGYQIEEVLILHKDNYKEDFDPKQRVDEILQLVGIDPKRKNCYPHEFSGGMKQRVVIAMALACSPELLIADEPTTALDVTIQAQILAMMEDLKKRLNMSMLLITHDLGVVAKFCDKVAVLYAGEIVEYGTFEDFFINKTHHPYTDGLFGSIPNIHDKSKRLNPIKGLMPDPIDLPTGCKFHPRCPNCMDICKLELPKDNEVNGHIIKCHLYDKGWKNG